MVDLNLFCLNSAKQLLNIQKIFKTFLSCCKFLLKKQKKQNPKPLIRPRLSMWSQTPLFVKRHKLRGLLDKTDRLSSDIRLGFQRKPYPTSPSFILNCPKQESSFSPESESGINYLNSAESGAASCRQCLAWLRT